MGKLKVFIKKNGKLLMKMIIFQMKLKLVVQHIIQKILKL
nr:MAG TPA: hypothetical protein [Caudoviricetes sp.]